LKLSEFSSCSRIVFGDVVLYPITAEEHFFLVYQLHFNELPVTTFIGAIRLFYVCTVLILFISCCFHFVCLLVFV